MRSFAGRARISVVVAASAAAICLLSSTARSDLSDPSSRPSPARASKAPPAPDPGGAESPDQPVPAPGKAFGFNSNLYASGVVDTPEEELDATTRAGAVLHRFGLPWKHLQPHRDSPTLGPSGVRRSTDHFYAEALARGVTPIFIIARAPVWATKYSRCGVFDLECRRIVSDSDSLPLPPDADHIDEYRSFAKAVKQRWPRAILESWNEPNLYWKDPAFKGSAAFAAEPEHFKHMQCAAYAASKAVNDDPVLAAGWSANHFAEYVGRVYAVGGKRCWDLANVHLYTGDEVRFGAGSVLARKLATLRHLKTRYDDADPIWVTETGFTTSGENAVTESTQREGASRLYNRLITMKDIGAVLFHTLMDKEGSRDDGVTGFGFLRADRSAKPIYAHFVERAHRD